MQKFFSRYKPGVPRRTHLLLAALLWTTVGLILMVRGCAYLIYDSSIAFFLPAILIGSLKSFFILDKSAKKSIDRIQHLADGSCLGAVYSIKTWVLVVVMMTMGYLLRHSGISPSIIGSLYVIIGWALFFSSRAGWKAWRAIA